MFRQRNSYISKKFSYTSTTIALIVIVQLIFAETDAQDSVTLASLPKSGQKSRKRSSSLCVQQSDTANLERLLTVAEYNVMENVDMPLQFMPVKGMTWEMQFFMAQNLLPQSLKRPPRMCHSKTIKYIEDALRKTIGFPRADNECSPNSGVLPVREFGLFAMFHSAVRSIFHATQIGMLSICSDVKLSMCNS